MNERFISVVREKPIDFTGHVINMALGLPVPQECDVERKRKSTNWPREHADLDALLMGLMREGKTWKRSALDRNPQGINVVNLLTMPKAWAYFILPTIVNTSCTPEMITNKAFILLFILTDEDEINVGGLMVLEQN